MPNTAHTNTTHKTPNYSARFLGAVGWILAIGLLFCAGQTIRYVHLHKQSHQLEVKTNELYTSVLGEDMGESPFGRLQFTHGKLTAQRRIGIDPLSLLATISKYSVNSMRVESLKIVRHTATISGFFGPHIEQFSDFFSMLSDNEQYYFTLVKTAEVAGGLAFIIEAEHQ